MGACKYISVKYLTINMFLKLLVLAGDQMGNDERDGLSYLTI